MQICGSHEAHPAGEFTDHVWVSDAFGNDVPATKSLQWDAIPTDEAMFKHGNLFQGMPVDPKRDLIGGWYSRPVCSNPDLLSGFIRTREGARP